MRKTVIDLNADLGEMETPQGRAAEHDILSYVSSANIACGGHAGSPEIMREMVIAAKAKGVVIGAHPGFPDRENFGRKPLKLGVDITPHSLRESLMGQIVNLVEIAAQERICVSFVKPHGALYTEAAKDQELAELIVECAIGLDPNLILVGAPRSWLERAANTAGLSFVAEGFIDRRYQANGHLVPRGQEGAVISDGAVREDQLKTLALHQYALTLSNQRVEVKARTLCLHGDSAGAVDTARRARAALRAARITVQSFIHADA